MSYLVMISDKHIIKKQPTLLDNFDAVFKLLTDEFGFKAQIKEDGDFEFFYNDQFPENILGYEDSVLWTKNPTDNFLQLLINISNRIENSRVIGDEGEWYVSLNEISYLEVNSELRVNVFLEYLKAWSLAIILIVIAIVLKIFFDA
ncbi:hypothetical protein [Neisseria yangbaofengii]|uniref:hypothetical protein n=1 Tax=Neisseria yangbaofengii TaxID=2709396 RepID=UPI0013EC8684|nr:hypothetical protein [Neisseria yangbaofengii]